MGQSKWSSSDTKDTAVTYWLILQRMFIWEFFIWLLLSFSGLSVYQMIRMQKPILVLWSSLENIVAEWFAENKCQKTNKKSWTWTNNRLIKEVQIRSMLSTAQVLKYHWLFFLKICFAQMEALSQGGTALTWCILQCTSTYLLTHAHIHTFTTQRLSNRARQSRCNITFLSSDRERIINKVTGP